MRSIITFLLFLLSSSILAQSKMSEETNPLVTFVELGSVRCVPCIQMQPIMKSIEQKYGAQIKVIFYDVWTDEGHEYAEIYKIQLIPTQVFLDENDNEIFRHVGFFPEVEIDKFLQERGLTIIN
jgi:thioredoxin 1